MFAGERVRHELPLLRIVFNKNISSLLMFQPVNCPKRIDMQIEIIIDNVSNINASIPMLKSSGSRSIRSSIVAIVK